MLGEEQEDEEDEETRVGLFCGDYAGEGVWVHRKGWKKINWTVFGRGVSSRDELPRRRQRIW